MEPQPLGLLNRLFPEEQRLGGRPILSPSASQEAEKGSCSPCKGRRGGLQMMDGSGEFWRTAWWRKEERAGVAGLCFPGPTKVTLFSETLTAHSDQMNPQLCPGKVDRKQPDSTSSMVGGGGSPSELAPLSRDGPSGSARSEERPRKIKALAHLPARDMGEEPYSHTPLCTSSRPARMGREGQGRHGLTNVDSGSTPASSEIQAGTFQRQITIPSGLCMGPKEQGSKMYQGS